MADAGLVRTDRTAGILEKDSEHLSHCDRTTHAGIVSFSMSFTWWGRNRPRRGIMKARYLITLCTALVVGATLATVPMTVSGKSTEKTSNAQAGLTEGDELCAR